MMFRLTKPTAALFLASFLSAGMSGGAVAQSQDGGSLLKVLPGGPLGAYSAFSGDILDPGVGARASVTMATSGGLMSLDISPILGFSDDGGVRVELGSDSIGATPSKLVYFTPRVANFQFGVSYTQKACGLIDTNSPDGGAGRGISAASCYGHENREGDGRVITERDELALGFNYQRQISNFDLGLSTAVVPGMKDELGLGLGLPELKRWNIGVSAGFMGFTVNTSYFTDRTGEVLSDIGIGAGRQETYDFGLKYDAPSWAVGVQYSHSDVENSPLGVKSIEQGVDAYEIGGSYVVGSALTFGATVQYWRWNNLTADKNNAESDRALVFLIGSVLKF